MDVILVDEKDNEIGLIEKMAAHREGKLHRAFSVFIFNNKKELLLQKRSMSKYHSGGRWSNTCCSHPKPGSSIAADAVLRLREEMGIEAELKEAFSFIYRAELGKGLTEHEFDHVFFGRFDKNPVPNIKEVSNWKWVQLEELRKDIQGNPEKYTPWLRVCIDAVIEKVNSFGLA